MILNRGVFYVGLPLNLKLGRVTVCDGSYNNQGMMVTRSLLGDNIGQL